MKPEVIIHENTIPAEVRDRSKRMAVAVVVPAKPYYCAGSLLWQLRYGPLQVASVLRDHGHTVRMFNEELGIMADIDTLAKYFDVIAISSKTSAITRAEEIAAGVKRRATELGRSIIVILGGEHASMISPVSPVFDHVLRGEAELALVQLLEILWSGRAPNPANTEPICESSHRVASFNNIPDIALMPGYARIVNTFLFRRARPLWMLLTRRIPVLSFQGTRGCPFTCSFCPTPTHLQGRRYRRRSAASAVEWLRTHVQATGIRDVIFEDPTAALPHDGNSHAFFEALADAKLDIRATVLVRSDLVADEALLKTMRQAGVSSVSIGLESTSLDTCTSFNKRTNPNDYGRCIETFKRHGFIITGLFIVGDDNDAPTCFQDIAKFIQEYGIEKWRVSPISQAPETTGEYLPPHRVFLWNEFEMYRERLEDWLNGDYVTIFPKHMPPSELQARIMVFQLAVTSPRLAYELYQRFRDGRSLLHRLGNNYSQRRLQRSIRQSGYIDMLREIEAPFYHRDGDGLVLNEDTLLSRFQRRR